MDFCWNAIIFKRSLSFTSLSPQKRLLVLKSIQINQKDCKERGEKETKHWKISKLRLDCSFLSENHNPLSVKQMTPCMIRVWLELNLGSTEAVPILRRSCIPARSSRPSGTDTRRSDRTWSTSSSALSPRADIGVGSRIHYTGRERA